MVAMSQFVKAIPAGGGSPPAKTHPRPPPPPPKPLPAGLSGEVQGLAEKAGMAPDEPLRVLLVALANKMDRLEVLQASFGPDAGRMAADAARREVSSGMRRVSWQLGAARWTASFAGLVLVAALSWYAGTRTPVATPHGPMPRALVDLAPLQNWPAQWEACRKQAPQNGVEWCLLPVITSYPKVDG